MRKTFLGTCALTAAIVLAPALSMAADAPKPDPKVAELEAQIQTLQVNIQIVTQQRNGAMDEAARLAAQIYVMQQAKK